MDFATAYAQQPLLIEDTRSKRAKPMWSKQTSYKMLEHEWECWLAARAREAQAAGAVQLRVSQCVIADAAGHRTGMITLVEGWDETHDEHMLACPEFNMGEAKR
jgi:hypothetical protein